MSKKRSSAEIGNEDPNIDGSNVLQHEDNAKRAKLTSFSDTTLQDLPIELLECILIKVVAMEVKGMKMAKSVWKEKADLVIRRLRSVCSHWSSTLTSNFFRNELHRALDGTAQQTIRLEILHQYSIQFKVDKVTTLKDELFVLYSQDSEDGQCSIKVYDRNSMAEVTDIPLPGTNHPVDIEACNVSNCVYVSAVSMKWDCHSILRITKDEERQFNVSPWMSDLGRLSCFGINVSPNGSPLIRSVHEEETPALLSIYDTHGSLQREITLTHVKSTCGWRYGDHAIQKSNGNFILISLNDQFMTELTEIDADGSIERQHNASLDEWWGHWGVNFADIYGRILITNFHDKFELLDSEFNPLDVTGPHLNGGQFNIPHRLHYDSERNEVVGTYFFNNYGSSVLTIFRFTEE